MEQSGRVDELCAVLRRLLAVGHPASARQRHHGTGHAMPGSTRAGGGHACLHLMVLTSTFHLPPNTL